MNYNHPLKNGSTLSIRLMCAIVFVVFSFAWLYFFQADVMTAAQHVLSGGLTRYKPLLGAVIITAVLSLLQLLVFVITRLTRRFHALTYVPSMMLLALLTDVSPEIESGVMSFWNWLLFFLILLLWVPVVMVARVLQSVDVDRNFTLLSRPMWINMLLMSLQIMFVAWMSNTNAVFHYRMKTEQLLVEGKYQKALEVGRQSLESDADLQMLRMYALSRENAIGERLFEYPVCGTSSEMLPTNGRTRMVLYPLDSLYRFMGARPAAPMEPMRYLQLLERRDSIVAPQVADYELCGLLIDKDLDSFVRRLYDLHQENDTITAAIIDRLPRHYREAMTLYTHLRAHPLIVYHNSVLEEDWQNLQELEAQYPDATERKGRVEEQYNGTYWYYYRYK